MKYNELHRLSTKKKAQRVGRGIAAGRGKTAGRGTKGQGSRKSGGVRLGFEGGQMPLYMRLPKLRGFRSLQPKTTTVNVGDIGRLKNVTIDNQTLYENGLIDNPHVLVKVLSNGEIKQPKKIKLQLISKTAEAKVKAAGGSFESTTPLKKHTKTETAK